MLAEEYGALILLRSALDTTISQTHVDELVDLLGSEAGIATVVTGVAPASGAPVEEFWQRLGEVFDSLREAGTGTVRLVMSGAGEERPDRPSVARRVADAWELEVIAPDGDVQMVPGGSLFVQPDPPRRRGWWSFSPGVQPVALGARQPAPAWQSGVEQVPARTDSGCVIEQIPAGLLARSPHATAPQRGDLCYSVPVDPRGPTVLVGVPEGGDVSASDVGEVLSALPQALWSRIRLAPGSPRDILRTGQLAAEMLDTEIVVYTGLPLLAPSAPTERGVARAVLVGADGNPRWRPFVDAVVCAPATEDEPAPSPRLLRWSPPLPGPGNLEHGIVRLSDRWQATVTRAGLWITERDGQAPSASTRAVDAEGPAIEVGRPGEELDPSLWPELTRLFERLGADVRNRARLYVHGTATDGGRALRAIAARHGVRTLRFTPRPAPALATRPTSRTAPPPVAHPTTGARPTPAARPAADVPSLPGSRPAAAPGSTTAASATGPTAKAAATGSAAAAGSAPGPRPSRSTPPQPGRGPAPTPGYGPARRPTSGTPSAPGTGPQPSARRPPAPHPAGGTPPPSGPVPSGHLHPTPGDRPAPGKPLPPRADLSPGPRLGAGPWSAGGPSPVSGRSFPSADGSSEPGPPRPPRPGPEGAAPAPEPGTTPSHGDVPSAPGVSPASGTRPTDGERSTTDPVPAPGTSAAPRTRPESAPSVTGGGKPAPGRPPSTGATPGPGPRFGRDYWAAAGPFPVPDTSSASDAAPSPDGDAGSGADTEAPTSPAAGERHVTPGPPPGGEPLRSAAPTPTPTQPAPAERAGAEEAVYVPPPPPARPPMMSVSSGSGDPDEKRPEPAETEPATAPEETVEPAEPQQPAEPELAESNPGPDPEPDLDSEPEPEPVLVPTPPVRRVAAPLPPVPFQPGHVSTEAERTAFRALAERVWDRHGTAVGRMLTRLPALRGQEQDAARADLIALHLYLHTSEGALSHDELARALRHGDKPLLPYAACLASGLRRLPSYRGVAFRGAGAEDIDDGLAPGDLLRDPAPVCALPLAAGAPRPRGAQYAISSVTGRRVRQLTDRPGAGAARDEVVFPPGTLMRVLDVREEGDAPLILLREVPLTTPNAQPEPGAAELDAADRAALDRMDEVLRGHAVAPGPFSWPELCDGPLGQTANRPVSD
ncbi:hypothetical protein [Streptomyces sp. Rer75]|uniref:hypothetical protein n=1 Tax=Streptomyces sp. Rer75 TaxID=2750011 RepID=UPI0015D0C531|nr:hypothetical protein [Streptomyces sp. Rer75]QLH26638.1 hypothetical protein HYQ63_43460 [Streptomyces sp. Rer75]